MLSSYLATPILFGDVIPTTPALLLFAVFVGVLISDLIGNMVAFDTPFVNAFVTMIVATIIVWGVFSVVGMTKYEPFNWPIFYVAVAAIVFVSDMIGNLVTFGPGKRFANALTTATIATLLVAVGSFVLTPAIYAA